MVIVQDTREQNPYTFRSWDVEIRQAALPAGDYSLAGFEDRVAVERKSLNDLVKCFMSEDRDRFERELAKGRSFELFAVVIEADLQDMAQGRYTSRMQPQAALQSMTAFFIRYRIPFMFCGSRSGAEYMTGSLLAKHLYEIEKRYKAAQGAVSAA